MKRFKSSLPFLIITILLFLFCATYFFWDFFSITHNEKEIKFETIEMVKTDREQLITSLRKKIADYDKLMHKNKTLETGLLEEKAKVILLVEKLEKLELEVEDLSYMKEDLLFLKKEVKNVSTQKKRVASHVTTEENNPKILPANAAPKTDSNVVARKNVPTGRKNSTHKKLTVKQLKITTIQASASGKEKETNKASKINRIKISFKIEENLFASPGTSKFYIQIFDAGNKIVDVNQNIMLSDNLVNYSIASVVNYKNKEAIVEEYLFLNNAALKPTSYFVNVFNSIGEIVATSNFNLE